MSVDLDGPGPARVEFGETPLALLNEAIAPPNEPGEAFTLARGRAVPSDLFEVGESVTELANRDRCTLAEFSNLGGNSLGHALGGRWDTLCEISVDIVKAR